MSRERELIKAMKILLECTYMDSRQRQADTLIGRAIELLAQPEPEQEPVVWQYRTKPIYWERWSKWEDCRKESYENYLHNWQYEVRELYTAPTKHEPLSEDDLEDRYANCEYDICYMDYRAGFRDAEKAHGIGGE